MEHIEIGVLTICYFLVSLALLFQRNHNVSLFLFYVVLGYLWSRACFVVCGDIRERESSFWWWNSWCVLILSLTLQNFIRNLWWNVVIFHLLLSQFGTLAFIIRLFSLNSMRILIWWLTYVCISIHSYYLVVNHKTFILVTNYKQLSTTDRLRKIYDGFPRVPLPQHLWDVDDMQQLSENLGCAKIRVEGCSSFLKAAIKWDYSKFQILL